VENVLGEVGGGFKVAMRILNNGRFGMGAALSGTMKRCIKIATEHATQRTQFGQKIHEFGLIQEKLAQMTLRLYATESMAYMLSANMDKGSTDYQIEAAIVKVFGSESAWLVCDEAIQVLGGMGFMKEAGLERVLRDIRIFRIFEGTNDILRMFIALTGVQSAGESLKGLQKALNNPLANLGVLANEAPKRLKRMLGQSTTSLIISVPPSLSSAVHLIEKEANVFAGTVEKLLMKYGKNIADQQLPLKRIANCAIDLYAMAATVSRAARSVNMKMPTAEYEVLLANTFAMEASERITQQLAQCVGQNTDKNIKLISATIIKEGGYSPTHPLGF